MELVLEFFGFFFNFVLFMLLLSVVRGVLVKSEAEEKEDIEELKDKLVKMIHFVKEEKHGDMLYWFDAHTDAFLGQGLTKDDLIDSVKARFPTHIFIDEKLDKYIKAPEWQLRPMEELTKQGVTDVPKLRG